MQRSVFFVSDRTGITAETMGHSLLAQFRGIEFVQQTLRFIDTPDKARGVIEDINRAAHESQARPIVFSTLVDPEIRRLVAGADAVFFDLVDTFIEPLEAELQRKSSHAIGLGHTVDQSHYNLRMDAVNYALTTDDGLGTQHYDLADVVILGVSRSGKTPTCLYLALTFGVYAANYPLTKDDLEDLRLPRILGERRQKLFGLSIDPISLQQIRQKRRPEGDYASLKQCQYEVRKAEALFRQEDIRSLPTTTISVEEIATTILQQKKLKSRLA